MLCKAAVEALLHSCCAGHDDVAFHRTNGTVTSS